MEIPNPGKNNDLDRSHKPRFVFGDESQWGNHCDGGWGLNSAILECIPQKLDKGAYELFWEYAFWHGAPMNDLKRDYLFTFIYIFLNKKNIYAM